MREYMRLFKYVKPYVTYLVLGLLSMFLATIFSIISLWTLVPIMDKVLMGKELVDSTSLNFPFKHILHSFLDYLNTVDRINLLYGAIIFIFISLLIKGVFTFAQKVLMEKMGQGVVRDIREDVYAHIHDLSVGYFSESRTGEIMSRITYDASLLREGLSGRVAESIFEGMQLFLCLFLIFIIDWKLSLMVLLISPAIIGPVSVIGRKIKKLASSSQDRVADISSIMQETLTGIRIVKAFNMKKYEKERFGVENQKFYRLMIKAVKREAFVSPIVELVGIVVLAGISIYGFKQVVAGAMTAGWLFYFYGLVVSCLKPAKTLAKTNVDIQRAAAAASKLFEILDKEPDIKDEDNAVELSGFRNNIEFRDVSFKYGGCDENVLNDVSIKVETGKILAIVGPSGAGKSTMVNLIPRFYDPVAGAVLIDGKDIRRFKLESLRQKIGIVTQDTILFNDTIANNISYGNRELGLEDIADAAKKANADSFIKSFQKGYDTVIGERGVKLSGGEKQRITIARALLKNPPILILDEATSSLDTESEKLVQDALNVLMKGRTVFVIAHRLSTVKNADSIIVLERGKVVQHGTHSALLNDEKGLYKKLYNLQFNL
ncbi:ABC transporter ATP-binding protein/permease [bacterium]|jgi:subfamily B ATP-binding cassette protein MsbA|nr:ABC transporter ATP-binding protein/permease [bacterium]